MIDRLFLIAESIETSRVGVAIAESRYAFAIIEGTHLIGLGVAVGLLFAIDLRLLGVFLRRVPAVQVLRQLRPYVMGGFLVVFLTGGLLFWSAAARMLESPAFVLKMVLVVLGCANAVYFEAVLAKTPALETNPSVLPVPIRAAAAVSLSIWTLVIIFGRMIPYLPRWS